MSGTGVKLTPDKTWVPIGVAIAGLASFVVGAFWFGLAYQKILSNQETQGVTLQRVERKVDGISEDFVTRERFDVFVNLLRSSNPNLVVPSVTR